MRILVKITGLTVAVIFFVTSSIQAGPFASPLGSALRPKAEANAGRPDLAKSLISGNVSTSPAARSNADKDIAGETDALSGPLKSLITIYREFRRVDFDIAELAKKCGLNEEETQEEVRFLWMMNLVTHSSTESQDREAERWQLSEKIRDLPIRPGAVLPDKLQFLLGLEELRSPKRKTAADEFLSQAIKRVTSGEGLIAGESIDSRTHKDSYRYKILIVCKGNRKRSPFFEILLKDYLRKNGLLDYFDISSVGTSRYINKPVRHEGLTEIEYESDRIPGIRQELQEGLEATGNWNEYTQNLVENFTRTRLDELRDPDFDNTDLILIPHREMAWALGDSFSGARHKYYYKIRQLTEFLDTKDEQFLQDISDTESTYQDLSRIFKKTISSKLGPALAEVAKQTEEAFKEYKRMKEKYGYGGRITPSNTLLLLTKEFSEVENFSIPDIIRAYLGKEDYTAYLRVGYKYRDTFTGMLDTLERAGAVERVAGPYSFSRYYSFTTSFKALTRADIKRLAGLPELQYPYLSTQIANEIKKKIEAKAEGGIKSSSAGKLEEILRDPQVAKTRAEDAVRDVFRFGQVHIFDYWREMREDEKARLLQQLKQVDFEKLDKFYQDYLSAKAAVKKEEEQIKPEQAISEEKAEREWADLADASLKKGELCVYLLAGGSGDRLGFNEPKGLLEASPLSGKTLYQIFAERVRVLSERNGRALPLIIQTSKDTYKQTLAYYEKNDYFGIRGQIQIKPAVQRSLPRLDEDGKIVMTSKSSIATSGFGHGDVTDYILKNKTSQSKKLRRWLERNFGTKYVQVIQIDNPLAPIGNKALFGTHIATRPKKLPKGQLHMTYALIEKKPPTEKIPLDKIGHLADVGGERKMIEYSDISPKTAAKFRLGSPNILIVSLDGIEDAPPLKPHTVEKKVSGRVILKFESFIFDNKSCGRAVKLERNYVFAPIKNRERERESGKVVEDSPITSKSIQSFYYAQKLRSRGWKIPADFVSGKKHSEVEFYSHRIEFSDEFLMSDEARIGKYGCFGKPPGALFLSGRGTMLGDNPRINGGLYVDVEDEKRGVVEIGDNVTFDGHIRIKVYGDGKLTIPDGAKINRDIIVFDGELFNYREDIDFKWRRSYEIKRFANMIFKTEDSRKATIEFLQDGKTIIDTDAGRMMVKMEHPRGKRDLYSVSLYRVDEDNKPQEQIGYFDFVYSSSFPERYLHSDYGLEEVEEHTPAAWIKPGYQNKGLGTKMALFALTFGAFHGVRFHNCWWVQTESNYLNRIGYEWKKVVGEDGEDYDILSFDLRKFPTLPQREELAGKARYPDDNSAQTKFSSAGNLNENLDPIRPSLPISIKGLKADAGNGYQYPVDVNIREDGLIDPVVCGDLEIEASCFDRYKNIKDDIAKQLRRRGYLIEERTVSGKDGVDYCVLLAPFDKAFLAPRGIVRADESIFMRDIRAKAAKLPKEVCYNLGRSFATLLRESTDKKEIWVPVGGDVRNSTPRIYYYYIRGLIDSGINVYSLGTAPTPTVYFASDLLSSVGYAIITGSHNPPEDNGIKQGISGNNLTFKQASRLKEIFFSGKYYRSRKKGKIVDAHNILDIYVDFLKAYSEATKEEWEKYIINGDNLEAGINMILDIHYGEMPLLNRRVAADSGSGCTGYLPRRAWSPLGAEISLLYPEADGAFPHHIPNPEEPENLKDLIEFVLKNRYDLGFAFDGDADRVAAVDPEIITGEDIYCIIAQDMLKENPGAKMVVEAKASYTLMDYIQKHGGKVAMSGVGVTNIRGAISREGAILGGETSGHIYHRDNGFRDDGLFTATVLLKIMAKTGKSIRQLLSDVHYYPTSPEIRIFLGENPGRRIIPDLKKMYQDKEGYEINTLEGVRVELKDNQGKWLGWFLVRASATEPKITVRFGGRNEYYYNRMGKELFGFLSRYEDVVEFGMYSDVAGAILSGADAIKVIPTPVTNAGSIKPSSAGGRGDIEKIYTSPIELAKHIIDLSSEEIDVTSAKKDLAAIRSEFEKMEVDFTTKPQIMEGIDFESLLPSCLLNFYLDPEDKESILTTPEYWRSLEYIESKRTKPEKGRYDIDPILVYSDPRYIEDLLSEEDVADIERLCYCPSFLIRRKAIRCLGIIHNIKKELVSKNRLLALTIDILIQDVLDDIYYLEKAFKDTGFLKETGMNIFGRPIEESQVKQVGVKFFGTGTEKLIYKVSLLLKDKSKPLVFVAVSIRPNDAASCGWETDRIQGADRRIITMSHQNWRGLIQLKNPVIPELGGIVDFKIPEPVVTVETYVNKEDGGIPGKLYLGREKEVVLYSVEFIEGETLAQILKDPSLPYRKKEDMAVNSIYNTLKIWLDTVNKDGLGVVLRDPHPSNFIYRKGELISIDNERLVYGYTFEECVREVLGWMERQELNPLILSKAQLKLGEEALRRRINLTPSEKVLQARDEAKMAAALGGDVDTRFIPGTRPFDVNEIVGRQRMGESIQAERAAYVNIRQAA